MANYCCTIRTNYFHVKDIPRFRELMTHVCGCENSVELWEEKDSDGETVFGFGVYGGIAGLQHTQDEEPSYEAFIDALQRCVADNDALILIEVGNEKIRYAVGSAKIITSKEYRYMEITDLAIRCAADMLGDANWVTRCCY